MMAQLDISDDYTGLIWLQFNSEYNKSIRVVRSCKTLEQYEAALVYAKLLKAKWKYPDFIFEELDSIMDEIGKRYNGEYPSLVELKVFNY